jgi:S1-C subfamily serine protease
MLKFKYIFLYVLTILFLTSCSIDVPVVVSTDDGRVIRGINEASVSGRGFFEVTDGSLTCSGSYNAYNTSRTISIPVDCSDGRRGIVVATREASGVSGTGTVRMDDGTFGTFAFGKAAERFAATLPPPPSGGARPTPSRQEKTGSSGTGMVVAADGLVLTNHHVIDGCHEIKVRRNNDKLASAILLYMDQANDLALLKINTRVAERDIAVIRTSPPVRNGEDIAVYGFPLTSLLSSSGNVTRGNISALMGLGDDVNFYQLTAPIQPGNSGGPLLDQSANVIGVVNSKLDELLLAKATGSLPQSVNFAIKANVVRTFLEAHNVSYRTASGGKKMDLPSIADIARRFTVSVVCQ